MRGKRKAKLFVAIVRPEPKRFRPKTWNAIPPRGADRTIRPDSQHALRPSSAPNMFPHCMAVTVTETHDFALQAARMPLLRCTSGFPASGLHELDLSRTSITDAGLKSLKGPASLRSVNLSRTHIDGSGLESIDSLTGLVALTLDDSKVIDDGLIHLRGVPGLGSLSLAGTCVTDAGLDYLRKLPHLYVLNLSRTEVTDAGLAQLQEFPALRMVTVPRTPTSGAAIDALRRALPGIAVHQVPRRGAIRRLAKLESLDFKKRMGQPLPNFGFG